LRLGKSAHWVSSGMVKEGSMKVGDLVKLNNIGGGLLANLRGIILDIFISVEGYKVALVTWTDGDDTKEWPQDLEVV